MNIVHASEHHTHLNATLSLHRDVVHLSDPSGVGTTITMDAEEAQTLLASLGEAVAALHARHAMAVARVTRCGTDARVSA